MTRQPFPACQPTEHKDGYALSHADLQVSAICLGSMTWGSQNDEAEGYAQIDLALDKGVNFIDTAEMYSVTPNRAETRGRTEEIIGSWIAAHGRRDQIILASKVSGPSRGTSMSRIS